MESQSKNRARNRSRKWHRYFLRLITIYKT
jgi:hypothetical protein